MWGRTLVAADALAAVLGIRTEFATAGPVDITHAVCAAVQGRAWLNEQRAAAAQHIQRHLGSE